MEPLITNGTMMHEHMYLDLSRIKHNPDTCLQCPEDTLQELLELKKKGITRILDVTNIGMGRKLEILNQLQSASGIKIIRSTGWYKDPFIPENWVNASVREMSEFMINELINGQASVIGEIGTSKKEWTPNEKKIFQAAIVAHKATGAPIYTHTTLSTLAVEQAQFLTENGVEPDKIIIGHVDLAGDLQLVRNVLAYGVNVGFDTVGKNDYLSDEVRVKMLAELEKEGKLDHVILSMDITRKSQLHSHGGPGYCYLMNDFVPMLKAEGLSDESIKKMLEKNPDRILGSSL